MWLEILLLCLTLFLFLYWYIVKGFGKWEKLGIPCISGKFPYGSHAELLSQKKHLAEVLYNDYQQFKDKDYFGTYMFGKAMLNINNPDIIRDVLVKHFNNFVDRNDSNLAKIRDGGDLDQMWNKQLTSLSGDAWKDVRSTFTPIFTSGKMRSMYRFMKEISSRLNAELNTHLNNGTDFELKDVFGKFSLDTLATCAFGIDPQSFQDKENTFVKAAARIFKVTKMDGLKVMSRLIPGMQKLQKMLNISVIIPKETAFFKDMITKTIRHRRQSGIRENDLIDLMIDCIRQEDSSENSESKKDMKDNVNTDDDQYEKDMQFNNSSKSKNQFDEETIVATSLVLLVAGYDTTALTLSYLGYELGKNPDIQRRLQEEVDEAFAAAGGEMPDYNTVQTLPYLESCIYETLRLHNPAGMLIRTCNTPIKLDGVKEFTLQKNDMIQIPVSGIHLDEKHYPNPHQFNPDNFSKEARQSRSPYTFLAFGQGPRACIGMRFALLEAKLAIMSIMKEFSFLPSSKNKEKLEMDPTNRLSYVKGGLWSSIERRS